MDFRENVIISIKIVKIDYFINIKIFVLSFINIFFIIKNKLFKMSFIKLYKLRFINNKLTFNIIYIILIKLVIKDYTKNL